MGLLDGLVANNAESVPEIKSDTPHYEAVGRFVTSYANAEASIHLLARHLSGLSDEKARLIFGGMRLGDLSEIVRQISRIDGLDLNIRDEIDACLNQFWLISKRRNIIVHRSSNFFDGKLLVTNLLTTKSLKSTQHEAFEVTELADMQSDCGRIYLRLDKISNPQNRNEEIDQLFDSILYQPWRYKPNLEKSPKLKTASSRRNREKRSKSGDKNNTHL